MIFLRVNIVYIVYFFEKKNFLINIGKLFDIYLNHKNFFDFGSAIFVGSIIGVIILNITLDKTAYEAMQAYEEGQISLAEYLKITDGLSILGIIRTGLSLLSTGGAALAIAGGIVNHVKAKNRTRKLKRRSIAEDYGGNGVEF